ncbi:MAG: hypothetical protein R2911_02000 [Caldilineaceae bacterium]
MTAKQQFRSEALEAIHETMTALHAIGAIDKVTMREFDADCIQTVHELKPEEIRSLLKRKMSRSQFLPLILMYLAISFRIGSAVKENLAGQH